MKTILNSLTGRFTRTPGERFRRSLSGTSINSRGTFLSRSLTGLSMSLVLLLAQFPIAHATTIGYWRMGDDTSLLTDSSGNDLTLTNNGSVSQTAIPGSGNGSAFSNPIPQTDATNTQMAQFSGSNSLSVSNPFDNLGSFTAEAFINSQATSTSTQYIMGQYSGSDGNRSWGLGKWRETGTTTVGANEMFLILSGDGTSATQQIIPLGLTPELNTDYYVAFSFDGTKDSNDITFYYQNLTAGGALTSSVHDSGISTVHNVTGTEASQFFRIGATNSGSTHGNNWNGLIDEVRISDGLLDQSQLLVIPEPGTLLLMGLGFASLLLTKRIRK